MDFSKQKRLKAHNSGTLLLTFIVDESTDNSERHVFYFIPSYQSIFDHNFGKIDLLDEWCRYYNCHVDFEKFDLLNYWELKGDEFFSKILISKIVLGIIWIPASCADVERSFSEFNLLETPCRKMSHRSLIDYLLCYYNKQDGNV